jgi:DNA phosphorothioation-dependent restriction protein DptG
MDLTQVIIRLHPNAIFRITNNDYNKLKWHETNTELKPTLAECEAAWEEILNEAPMKKLREERDKKLLETDKYSITDWPHASEEVKQAWITYRQELRDLPSNSTPSLDENGQLTGVTWPTSPS